MSENEVKCLICHETFKRLGVHLSSIHGIDTYEYVKRFSGAETTCAATRRQISVSATEAHVSDPTLSYRKSELVCQAYQDNPILGRRMSETKLRNYADDISLGWRISESKLRAHENDPALSQRIGDSLRKTYENDPTLAQRQGESRCKTYKNDPSIGLQISNSLRKTYENDPSIALGVSDKLKRLWADPEEVKWMTKNRNKHPNMSEARLGEILNSYFPGEWRFVGNGEVNIGGRLPDFVNINGKKAVVEMFGLYWHDPEIFPNRPSEEELISHYRSYGFECLVFWEDVVWGAENLVVESVRGFVGR